LKMEEEFFEKKMKVITSSLLILQERWKEPSDPIPFFIHLIKREREKKEGVTLKVKEDNLKQRNHRGDEEKVSVTKTKGKGL
jgi:hypothetical protein